MNFLDALRLADEAMNEPQVPVVDPPGGGKDGDAKEGGVMGGFLKGCFYTAGTLLILAVLAAAGGGGYLAYTGQLAKYIPPIKCVAAEGGCCGGEASCSPGVGEKGGETDANFDLTPEKIAGALVGKAATADGLAWNFLPDQKIQVKVLETKVSGSSAVVAVQLNADAVIPAEPTPPAPPPTEVNPPAAKSAEGGGANKVPPPPGRVPVPPAPQQPKSANLSGVARVQFDHVAGTWYLIGVESLSLRITAK